MGNQSFCPESHLQYHSHRQSYIQKACKLKNSKFPVYGMLISLGMCHHFGRQGLQLKAPNASMLDVWLQSIKLFFPWTFANVRRRGQNLKEVYPLSSFMGFICAIPNVSTGLTSEKKNASRVPRTQFSQITIFSHEYFAIYSKARVLSLLAAYENT